MGVGWVAIVSPEDAQKACLAGPGGFVIGTMREGEGVHVKVAGE
jgi:phosphoribosylformylglycinamidine cyclo-ligase